jgi:hypothetical protein
VYRAGCGVLIDADRRCKQSAHVVHVTLAGSGNNRSADPDVQLARATKSGESARTLLSLVKQRRRTWSRVCSGPADSLSEPSPESAAAASPRPFPTVAPTRTSRNCPWRVGVGMLATAGYPLTVASSVPESAGEGALGRTQTWCRNSLHLFAITSETVEYQAGDAGDSREILVEGKNANAMFESNGCNQGVNRGERNASCTSRAVDRGCFPIGCKSARF